MASNKICTIASSDNGDRIYCLYKEGTDTLAKGFYDFNQHLFIVTEFYSKKLTPGQTPREAIEQLQEILDLDFDWELKDADKLIKNIEEGMQIRHKKKKRKRNKTKK